jgi:hypothetical protein
MREGHVEEFLRMDQVNPMMKPNHNESRQVGELWRHCKQQVSVLSEEALETSLKDFIRETWEMQAKVKQFTSFLKETPFVIAFGSWLKGISSMDGYWLEKYLKAAALLLEKNLIPLLNSRGEPLSLDAFQQIGHQKILEDIRCVTEWTALQKEEAVQCYVQFTHSLARYTCHFILPGFDPDRNLVNRKKIKYEAFLDFVQKLPERDALIAKLLYFGSPSMESVFSLKTDAIHLERSMISFPEGDIVYPRHLIKDLLLHIQNRKRTSELVFTNVRGAEVERAHLNQSFSRACEKMPSHTRITPGNLLRFENEKSEDFSAKKLNL